MKKNGLFTCLVVFMVTTHAFSQTDFSPETSGELFTIDDRAWNGRWFQSSTFAFSADSAYIIRFMGWNFGSYGFKYFTAWKSGMGDEQKMQEEEDLGWTGKVFALSPDGKLIASEMEDGRTIAFFDVNRSTVVKKLTVSKVESPLLAVSIGANGELFASASAARPQLKLWNLPKGTLLASVDKPVDAILCHPTRQVIVFYGEEGFYRLDSASRFSPLPLMAAGPAAFSSDGKLLVTGSPDDPARVLIWDTGTWKVTKSLDTKSPLTAIAISPDGAQLVVGGESVKLMSVATGRILRVFPRLAGATHVAFSPDGTKFAAANKKMLSVWGSTQHRWPKELDFVFSPILKDPSRAVPLPLATSSLPSTKAYDYSPKNAFDGNIDTAWVEGAKGAGEGERIAFFIPDGTSAFAILPGFGVEKYFSANSRVKKATLRIYSVYYLETGLGGHSIEFDKELSTIDLQFEDVRKLQTKDLGRRFETTEPQQKLLGVLEIRDVYRGQDPDTCIAEIQWLETKVTPRWTLSMGEALSSPPEISADALFACSGDTLFAVERATGTSLWRYDLGGADCSGPHVRGQNVYVANSDGTVQSLDARTGKDRGKLSTGKPWKIRPVMAEGSLFVVDLKGVLSAIDLTTGKTQWSNSQIRWDAVSAFSVSGRFLFVCNGESASGAMGIFDARSGTMLWQKEWPLLWWADIVDGYLIAIDANAAADIDFYLTCIKMDSGDVAWDRSWHGDDLHDFFASSSMICRGNEIFETATGKSLWKIEAGFTSPAVCSGTTAYFTDKSGSLNAADRSSGVLRWKLSLGGPMHSPIVYDGLLYFEADGQLYAIDTRS
jgi:WD40 repeat protein